MPIKNSSTNPDKEFADLNEPNNCFSCKFLSSGSPFNCKHRKAKADGRGKYCYPRIYDQCDCGGWVKEYK